MPKSYPRAAVLSLLAVAALGGCSLSDEVPPAQDAVVVFGTGDPFDIPVKGLTAELRSAFTEGDGLFDLPLRPYDGLGPLYTRAACSDCHTEGVRGPGLVQKMAVMDPDGVTPSQDQSKLPFGHTVHPLVSGGATTPVLAPTQDPAVRVTTRLGPPILGRGYLEAISDDEIMRAEVAQAQRADGIHGRANRLPYTSEVNEDTRFHTHRRGDLVIGRFGLKARIATVDDFTADALQGDMGITSPLRPQEIPNPDGLLDDFKPGVDVGFDSVNGRAMYVRLTAIPDRRPDEAGGSALFMQAACGVCHQPSMKTRADYPIAPLAGIDAFVYTDLLLHDLGEGLADGISEGQAGGRDWRSAPLIGLRFNRSFMHHGRAKSVEEAISAHEGVGSEANGAVAAYRAMSATDRHTLLHFVEGL